MFKLRFWFILYKKGTIYITFIKSFSIIKYNITLLQKFQIPATIQDKLPIRVHTVSFFHFNFFCFVFCFFKTTSSPSCANNSDKTRLNFLQKLTKLSFLFTFPPPQKKRRLQQGEGQGWGGVGVGGNPCDNNLVFPPTVGNITRLPFPERTHK